MITKFNLIYSTLVETKVCTLIFFGLKRLPPNMAWGQSFLAPYDVFYNTPINIMLQLGNPDQYSKMITYYSDHALKAVEIGLKWSCINFDTKLLLCLGVVLTRLREPGL